MPNSFTITTATHDLKADAKGHAEAVFAVTNTTTRPMRGMAKVRKLENTKQEWLQISGATELDFPPGGTQQFTVTFDAPPPPAGATKDPTKPAEQYSFRLDVASAMNPEEDVTEGPPVKVQVTGPPPPPSNGKPFPKWIFIPIAAVLLIVIGVVAWLLLRDKGPKTYVIPDVASAPESEARERLESECEEGSGCVVVEISAVPDNTVAKGIALATDPVAETEVPVGSKVILVISSGPEERPVELYKLPAVVNLAEAAAKSSLETGCKKPEPCVKLEVNRIADNKVPAGVVIRTEPEAGTDVNLGEKVTMFVSQGANKVTIIDVANDTAENAMDRLEKSCEPAPCLDVQVTRIADNKVPKGRVIRSSPGPGGVVQAGGKVMLFVSGGTDEVTIPIVRNLPVAQARLALTNACKPTPCLQITQNSLNDALMPAGKAINTVPRNGSSVKIGSTIVLNVSLGPELRTVNNYTKLLETLARQKIAADGFVVGTVKKVRHPLILNSIVTGQDPAVGLKRARGTRINLTVLGR